MALFYLHIAYYYWPAFWDESIKSWSPIRGASMRSTSGTEIILELPGEVDKGAFGDGGDNLHRWVPVLLGEQVVIIVKGAFREPVFKDNPTSP